VSQLGNQPTKTVGDKEYIEFRSKLGLISKSFRKGTIWLHFPLPLKVFVTPRFGRNLGGRDFFDTPDKIFP